MVSDQAFAPLSEPSLKCQPHALPFRTIFGEYGVRRRPDLLNQIFTHLKPTGPRDDESLLRALDNSLACAEKAYADLEDAKQRLEDTETFEAACFRADIPLKQVLHGLQGSALCLSGGGIRSASYSLGILEGLSRYSEGQSQNLGVQVVSKTTPLLHGLDYLSTVSGGGYIGSWLTAWILRKGNNKEAYADVITALAGDGRSTSGDPGPRTVRHLRDYTSFLAPKLGLSLDTWALIAIVLRNLLVNWILIIPLLLALIALPQVARYMMLWAAGMVSNQLLLGLATALFLLAAATAAVRMPSRQKREAVTKYNREPFVVFSFFAVPLFVASLLLAEVRLGFGGEYQFALSHVFTLFAIGVVCFGVITWFLFTSHERRLTLSNAHNRTSLRLRMGRFGEFLGVTAVIALLAAITLEGLAVCPMNALLELSNEARQSAFLLCAIPLIFAVLLAASSLLSGFLGLFESEIDREWWGRAGGLMIFLLLGWAGALALTIYGPEWAENWYTHLCTFITGAASGGVGLAAASSGKTSAGTRPVKSSQIGAIGKFLTKYHLIVPVLCSAGLLVIGIELAALEYRLAGSLAGLGFIQCIQRQIIGFRDPFRTALLAHATLLAAAAGIAILANWFVNINIFSLHGMYRMRLMRAFLGASNTQRKPDDFVDFDPADSPAEIQLPRCEGVPLHVINSTLNLVGTQQLAWQQRKAESFTFSSVSCGGWRVGYVPTGIYGGVEGVSLATAMAISGAAFNPNMGYHSSPLVTFLMTMFNVRLGWWLPNPSCAETVTSNDRVVLTERGKRYLRKNGPTLALVPLLREAFGQTDSTYKWIELTDGAHFENLALYEMVLRRCHRIIVVDVGADPDYQFEDLGNAMRKIEIDLGIPIRFNGKLCMRKELSEHNLYCAVAKIDYKCADRFEDSIAPDGALVYIKASLRGDEPPDILQYAATHGTFPHETTANQFFNESQFESYRHLGSFVLDQIVRTGIQNAQRKNSPLQIGVDMESFFRAAAEYVS